MKHITGNTKLIFTVKTKHYSKTIQQKEMILNK